MNTNDKDLKNLQELLDELKKAQEDTLKQLRELSATIRILEDIDNA